MRDQNPPPDAARPEASNEEPKLLLAEVVHEALSQPPPAPPRPLRRRWKLPLALFIATCVTTFVAGSHLLPILITFLLGGNLLVLARWGQLLAWDGFVYAGALMTILLCHEAGHYLQARRYGVRASLPFFIPVPFGPIGTMGAVIGMSSAITHRRALFDIGITGPLAGLVPTLICCVVGVQIADVGRLGQFSQQYGDPLLLKLLYRWHFGPIPPGYDVTLNPVLWAGWVGLLVTAINLIPIGQLDGGHVLYALARKKAHRVATLLLLASAAAVIIYRYYWWTLMLVLLVLMGPKHPPTRRDDVPLGVWRHVLGWLTLAFIAVGFTPNPFKL